MQVPRSSLVLTAALLWGATALAAPAYLEQVVTTGALMDQPERSSTQKMWVADGKTRVEDVDSKVVTIVRHDLRKIFTVDSAAKSYSEIPMEQIEAMAKMGVAMLQQMGGDAGPLAITLRKNGKTRRVGSWETYGATLSLTGPVPGEIQLWMAKDVPIDAAAWMDMAEMAQVKSVLGEAAADLAALEGFPVRTEMSLTFMGTKVTGSTEVKRITPGPVDAALFDPPAGYKKTEGGGGMMQMMQQAQPPPAR